MEELNELKEKVDRLNAAAKKEYDSNASRLEEYFKSLLKDFRVRVDVDLGVSEYRFAVDLLKDDGTAYFGAGFTLRYGRKYDYNIRQFGPASLSMNYGTCGEFQIKAEPEYAAKVKMMSTVVSNVAEIEATLASITLPIIKEYKDARFELNRLLDEKEKEEKAAKEKAIRDRIAVGAEFSGTVKETGDAWKAVVTKVTSKRVYLSAKLANCIAGTSKIHYIEVTGYADTERLVRFLRDPNSGRIDGQLYGVTCNVGKVIDKISNPEDFLKNM